MSANPGGRDLDGLVLPLTGVESVIGNTHRVEWKVPRLPSAACWNDERIVVAQRMRLQGVVVRDETRLDTAAVLEEAVLAGRRHAADGFTVWIYRVEDTGGGPARYLTVKTIDPA